MATRQLSVTANFASGNTETVTGDANYESSDEAVATVSNSGRITAVAEGTATVTVTYRGATGTCAVTVVDPVEDLDVSPSSAELELEE